MKNSTPIVIIERADYRNAVDLKLGFRNEDGSLLRILPMTMQRHEADDENIPSENSLSLRRGEGQAFLQAFMDALWEAGVRPRDIGTAGHLAATEKHLEQISGILEQVLPKALRE